MDYISLLHRTAQNDQQAFRDLYHHASPLLFSILKNMLRDHDLAEDVLQETFLKIWQHAGEYAEHKGKPMTWMGTIARNVARDKLRSLKVRHYQDESSDDLDVITSTDLTPEDQANVDHELALVNNAMANLQETQRQCLIMSYYQGYSHSEIAERLNTSIGTIKAWIRRGRVQVAMAA